MRMGRDMTWSSAPLIRDDETMAFEAGVNLAVHPAYETGSMFVVICDNYLVEESGVSECLHKTQNARYWSEDDGRDKLLTPLRHG